MRSAPFRQRLAALLDKASRLPQVRLGKAGPFIRRGDAARDARAYAVAAAFYEEALRRDPRNAAIHIQCGHMHKEAGNLQAAGRHYRRARRLTPRDPDLHLQLGHFHKVAGRLPEAAAAYRQAIALAPDWLEPQRELTRLAAPSTPFVPWGNFDGIAGTVAMGWAIDPARPDQAATVEFLVNGAVIAACLADQPRDDVQRMGIGAGRNGFRCKLPPGLVPRGAAVHARLKDGPALGGSPCTRRESPAVEKWLARSTRLSKRTQRRLRERLGRATEGQLLSFIMPVFNTRHDWLRAAVGSVRGQWCPNWELVCVDDASTDPAILPLLHGYARQDARIRVVESGSRGGLACATNKGIRAARGEYVALIDHDDHLEPDAAFKLLRAARTGAELIYSDEAVTEEDLDAVSTVMARPAFSYDYYLSHPYFVHVVCVRRRLALELGGWDEALPISADVDFVLRVIERARHVAHVPAVLYRWRTHAGSAGHRSRTEVTEATAAVLRAHLARVGVEARVGPGLEFNQFRIDFPAPPGRTLLIVPTRNRADLLRTCLQSIARTVQPGAIRTVVIDHESDDPETLDLLRSLDGACEVMPWAGPFNYAAMHNAAVDRYAEGCDTILFANNDVEATEPGWLDAMRSLAARPDVGAVGATLLYPDGTIQHGGVVIGINGLADHAHRLQPFMLDENRRSPGPGQSLVSVREYSAVTAACMMVRTAVFQEVGGFDELFAVGFNDTDLCLRIGEAGYKVLMTPYAVLVHHESATRAGTGHTEHPGDSRAFRRTWGKLIADGDPFYSPLLALDGPDHRLGVSPGAARRVGRVRVRPVVLPGGAYCVSTLAVNAGVVKL